MLRRFACVESAHVVLSCLSFASVVRQRFDRCEVAVQKRRREQRRSAGRCSLHEEKFQTSRL